MKRKLKSVVASLVLACLAPLAMAVPVLYGVTGARGAPSSLYTVDPVTGATTLIGTTGFSHITGLDFDPTTSLLYAVVSDADIGINQLLTLNPLTGAGMVVGNTGVQIPDITIGPDGVLRGWSERTDDPIVINKATGAVTTTSSGLGTFQTGVASASATSIYVKSNDELNEVDVATGVSTLLFNTGVSQMSNMLENAPDGTLISGTRTSGGGTQFYSIDVGAMSATSLGLSNNIAFSALAYQPMAQAVPEPAGIALTGAALAMLALVRRRKL